MTFPPANITKQMTNYLIKVVFLEYCFIGLGAGFCFGQAPMPPTNMVIHVTLPQNPNVWKADAYTLTNELGATQVVATFDSGIVGVVTIGTNIVPVSGSEQTATTADGLTEIIEQDDVKVLWYPKSSILYTPDLFDWQTFTVQCYAEACFPKTNSMFFKLP